MELHRHASAPATSRRSRGAAVLEMVLVTPLLLLLLFGVGEFGLAYVSGNKVEGAVSAAARVASSQGSVDDADRAVLMQVRASLPSELLANVERVVVYRSDNAGYIHPQCLSNTPQSGVSGWCNVYSGTTVRNVTGATVLGGAQNFWEPDDRLDTLAGPPDYIGVLVETRHDDFSGTFWRDGFDLERRSVYRIQPDING